MKLQVARSVRDKRAFPNSKARPRKILSSIVIVMAEVVGVERVPITFTVDKGKGTLGIGQRVHAELVPFTGPTGEATTLHESIFSTIPGSPAYVSSADHYRSKIPELGHDLNLQN